MILPVFVAGIFFLIKIFIKKKYIYKTSRRVSTTVDPYWDISLELNGCSEKQKKQSNSTYILEELSTANFFNSNEFSNNKNSDVPVKSLEECLRKYFFFSMYCILFLAL